MKIAYDHQIFLSQRYGGISRYFTKLAEELLRLQQDVRIFSRYYRNHYLNAFAFKRSVRGTPIVGAYRATRLFARLSNEWSGRLQMGLWQPHLIHETYYNTSSSGPPAIPAVVTVYDMISEIYRPSHRSHRHDISFKKKSAVDRATHVICISARTQSDLIDILGVPREKTSVIHLACSLDPSEPSEDPGIEWPFILYVGQRNGYKNFARFIEAVGASKKLSQDVGVVAFGGGRFSQAETTQILRSGLSLHRVIQVSGSDAVLSHLYHRARAFIYPSEYEGFGLPPLEAMAHDCPVISSNGGSMPEVIGDAAIFFDPSSPEEMTQAMEAVVYGESNAQYLIERGRARLDAFSWRKCAEQTLSVYQRVVREA